VARSRNIKHAFFTNDELAEIKPLGRLLFIGMWTLADFKGDLEYRPKRLKVELLPYDNCDINGLVEDLHESRFIAIYHDQGKPYIHISNFTKHQNPHPNEKKKGSKIPSPTEINAQVADSKGVAINHDSIVKNQNESVSDRADSCSLIPDSCSLNVCPEPKAQDRTVIEIPTNRFNTINQSYLVTEAQVAAWVDIYPSVDIPQTLKRIKSWCVNNPTKRKTLNGVPAFLDKWLAKEHNNGGGKNESNRSIPESSHARAMRLIQTRVAET
jgi:hypothetical protein